MQILEKFYKSPSKELWQGRRDGAGAYRFHDIIETRDLRNPDLSIVSPSFGILGFACDEGIKRNQGRSGAIEGPAALRRALAKLPFPWGNKKLYDYGDIVCPEGNLEEAQIRLADAINQLHQYDILPILLGGGHEIAWAHYQGLVKSLTKESIGVINFDAHFDLRPMIEGNQGSSGTSFSQISNSCFQKGMPFNYLCLGIQSTSNTEALFKKAKELNVKFATAEEFYLKPLEQIENQVREFIEGCQKLYVTVCLDVFAAAFAPGVSAPQALGLNPWHVIRLLKLIASSEKVVGFDIAELSPIYDRDDMTANLAAGLVFHFLSSISMLV